MHWTSRVVGITPIFEPSLMYCDRLNSIVMILNIQNFTIPENAITALPLIQLINFSWHFMVVSKRIVLK
ncbi:MAG: hypothetical protein WBB43_18800 [Limnoraphis sp.]